MRCADVSTPGAPRSAEGVEYYAQLGHYPYNEERA